MTKAKTNALDALRALIAERQQYEQWIATLEAKREGTPEHVFERVQSDYQNRLQRVITDIRGHAEELQLSISTLSSRLVEVAREEDTRREGLQEAELRAAVGEYEPEQWEQLRGEAEQSLEKIAGDRAALDSQLAELRSIQKLSESGSVGTPPGGQREVSDAEPVSQRESVRGSEGAPVGDRSMTSGSETRSDGSGASSASSTADDRASSPPQSAGHRAGTSAASRPSPQPAQPRPATVTASAPSPEAEQVPLEPVAAAASAAASSASRPRSGRTPPDGVRSKSDAAKPDQSKTLKCPECGTANYPTEWYCERCGGELATM